MKSLEERQKEWDEKYNSPSSQDVKSRPIRPSREEDDLNEMQERFSSIPLGFITEKVESPIPNDDLYLVDLKLLNELGIDRDILAEFLKRKGITIIRDYYK